MTATRSLDRYSARLLDGARALCNGLSQIFFHTNAIAGLLILVAFVLQDWQMAGLVSLGSLVNSGVGLLVGASADDVRAGKLGFCGALVGAAAFADIGSTLPVYLIVVAGAAACAPLSLLLSELFARRPLASIGLPATTAPFCIIAGIVFLGSIPLHVHEQLLHIDTRPKAFGESLLTNVSQVVLVDRAWGGVLILLALFVANWKAGLAAILGSVVGSLCDLVMNVDSGELGNGLAGYSGVLTAIAFAAVFLHGRWSPWVLAVLGTAVTAVMTLLINRLSGPTYTWPYILTLWAGLIAVRYLSGLERVEHVAYSWVSHLRRP